MICFILYFFFFKQKTAYEVRISDWSSDVCSSVLTALDARLFDRNPKGYSLTEVGQRLLPSAEAMETTTLQAQAKLQGRDESLEGVVRLGAPDGFGSFFLAPRIHKLAHRHPKLELQLVRSEEHTSEIQ